MAKSLTVPHGVVQLVDDVPAAFARAVEEAFGSRSGERFTMVASGGPTARECYERLAASSARTTPSGRPGGEARGLDWRLVDVLMGDERCVPADHPDANQRLVREALLDRIGTFGSFHPMSCERPEAYQHLLEDVGRFDLVHLGLGPDGHTASLFPNSPELEAPRGVLVLRCADLSGRNPHDRMTISLDAISRANTVVFTVAGESKRDAFETVRRGADVPAARVRAAHVVWLVDPAAAGTS